MSPKNLWGQLPAEELRPPIALLKEQAKQLRVMTRSVLSADVFTSRSGSDFELEFRIIAPALDDYAYSVLFVEHTVDLYPLKVTPAWSRYEVGSELRCQNEEEFEEAVGEILSSDRVGKVIASLLAQSKA